MAGTWYRARAVLRRNAGGTVSLALLVGLAGSVVLGGAAGARRTASALDRLVIATGGGPDAIVHDVGAVDPEAIAGVAGVARSVSVTFLLLDALEPKATIIAFAISEPQAGAIVRDGTLPDPGDPHAAAVDSALARELDIGVGDELTLGLYTVDQFAAGDFDEGPLGPAVTVHVDAVLLEPDDIASADPLTGEQVPYGGDRTLYLPLSFVDRYGGDVTTVNTLLGLELEDGATFATVRGAIRDLPGGETVQFFTGPTVSPTTQRAVDAEALGLALFAGGLGVVSTLTLGQALARRVRSSAGSDAVLGAVGMVPGQRIGVAAWQGAVVGLGGAVLAALGAVAWSALMPIGLARHVESEPGVDVDLAVLGAGSAAIVLAFVVRAALVGRSVVRRAAAADPPRPVWPALLRRTAAPSAEVAVALAGGRAARGWWRSVSLLVGAAVVVGAAASTLTASLAWLVGEPSRFGWTFDAVAGNPFAGHADLVADALDGAGGVDAAAASGNVAVAAGGVEFAVIGIEDGAGVPLAAVEDGRPPTGRGEIAMGGRTMDDLGVEVGDRIEVDAGAGPVPLTVTGRALVPEVGAAGVGFGEGGVVSLDTFAELGPGLAPTTLLLDLAEGITDEQVGDLRLRTGGLLLQPVLPSAVFDLYRLRHLPVALGAAFAVLAVASVVHALVELVAGRRRDIAVLKSLGVVRRDIAGGAVWLAGALATAALAVGVPLGIVGGRFAWTALVEPLGTTPHPAVPAPALVLLGAGTLAVGMAAGLVPGWLAARTDAARALRA